VLGTAIRQCARPPAVWLQASTATIYQHTFGAANDEVTGVLGGDEPGVPRVWNYSIQIAKNWEAELDAAETPHTRRVALRAAIMMGVDQASAFEILSGLARRRLGGRLGSGRQYVSWIHEVDFVRALDFLIESDLAGPVNVCAPHPLPQVRFARELREAWGVRVGLPAMPWMVALGAWVMDADSELVMKSRHVVPRRLQEAGFEFEFPEWGPAVRDLVARMRGDAVS
jgi:NAD dependent epimerase/dehydratase family enzyme